jgi:SAM-dependent methyltransferase
MVEPPERGPEEVIERERRLRDHEAETYDRRSERLGWELRVMDIVLASTLEVHAEHVVLDAGCGTGRHLPGLLDRARSVIGVDHSERSLDVARRRVGDTDRLRLAAGDLRRLPLADGEVDRILCSETIGHIPTAELRAAAARELLRVLRPGGVVVATGYRWLGRIRRHKDGAFDTGLYRFAFTTREFGALFRDAGFTDVMTGAAPVAPAPAKGLRVSPERAARLTFTPLGSLLGHFVITRAVRPAAAPDHSWTSVRS